MTQHVNLMFRWVTLKLFTVFTEYCIVAQHCDLFHPSFGKCSLSILVFNINVFKVKVTEPHGG